VVGGKGDRGVVAAASYEAREFGVRSAMPAAIARRLCPEAVFVRGSMDRYSAESKRIFEIFRETSPKVEGLSLDEAFLDLRGTERLLGSAVGVAERLRARVRAETGLAVSVGIGPVKLVAKIASGLCKPDGLLEIPPDTVREFMDPLPVRAIWGVGPVAEARLARAGFHRVGDLSRADGATLERLLGDWGCGLGRLARGEDLREVEPYRDARSYSEENTFESDVSDLPRLEQTMRIHAESVARRLRKDGVRGKTVVLKLKLGRRVRSGPRGFPVLTRQETLAEASDDGAVIAAAARRQLYRAALEEPVRLLGVGVTGLLVGGPEQLRLFGKETRERAAKLNRALDVIADRFGRGAIARAGTAGVERAGLSLQIKRGEDPED